MQEALLVGVPFPPPAPGTLALPRSCGAGARSAADRRIPLVVQRVMVDVVGAEAIPHLGARPSRQRGHLVDVLMTGLAAESRRFPPVRPGHCAVLPRIKSKDVKTNRIEPPALVDEVVGLLVQPARVQG